MTTGSQRQDNVNYLVKLINSPEIGGVDYIDINSDCLDGDAKTTAVLSAAFSMASKEVDENSGDKYKQKDNHDHSPNIVTDNQENEDARREAIEVNSKSLLDEAMEQAAKIKPSRQPAPNA